MYNFIHFKRSKEDFVLHNIPHFMHGLSPVFFVIFEIYIIKSNNAEVFDEA